MGSFMLHHPHISTTIEHSEGNWIVKKEKILTVIFVFYKLQCTDSIIVFELCGSQVLL